VKAIGSEPPTSTPGGNSLDSVVETSFAGEHPATTNTKTAVPVAMRVRGMLPHLTPAGIETFQSNKIHVLRRI